MGKFTTLTERIENTTTEWEGHTGSEVEDFICTLLDRQIESGEYNAENSVLSLKRANGESLDIDIAVISPEYYYGLWVYGIDVNGTQYLNTTNTQSITLQYNSNKTIKLGVVLYAVAQTNIEVDRIKPYKVNILYGSRSITKEVNSISKSDCIVSGEDSTITGISDTSKVKWVDVTSLFAEATDNGEIKLVLFDENGSSVKEYTSNLIVTTDIISLTYNGSIVLASNSVGYTIKGVSSSSNYHLEGYQYSANHNGSITRTGNGVLTYTSLDEGLNRLVIRAVNNTDSTIYSDYIYTDIIWTNSGAYTDTTVAINNSNDTISNNDTATIYNLTVYSPKSESVEIATYLENNQPNETLSNLSGLIKREIIDASYYEDGIYSTEYSKYIESEGTNTSRYLVVQVNGEIYKFNLVIPFTSGDLVYSNYNYKLLTIDAINNNYTYYKLTKPIYNYDLINGYSNDIFVTDTYATSSNEATINPNIEFTDGWVEENNRTIFRISAQDNAIFKNPIALNLENLFTLEFGFKTFNVSDESKSILTIGNFLLRPTLFCWNSSDSTIFNERNAIFNTDTETHILVTLHTGYTIDKNDIYYPDYLQSAQETFDSLASSQSINLVRIYVNGVINREIKLQASEVTALKSATLLINPTSSDIDFYLLRVYNNIALDYSQVQLNYISFLKTKSEKEVFYNKNDILNSKGEIDFKKSNAKYNTLVYVFNKNMTFPSKGWGTAMSGDTQSTTEPNESVTLFVNYIDPSKNASYGGRITNGLVKGQGSSAMRYLIWNPAFNLGKYKVNGVKQPSIFTPYSQLNTSTNKFVENVDLNQILTNCYIMPPYDGLQDTTRYKVSKLVGKVNYASSMQSHKIGACKLYNDAAKAAGLSFVGLKAVHEEPFLYFYWETDLDDVSNIELADILANNDSIKFMGFQTWGSAKGDKETFGYSDDTPEYMLFEGAENDDYHCNFLAPWHELQRSNGTTLESNPVVDYETSLSTPWEGLLISNDSIYHFGSQGAWDIDFGTNDDKNGIIDSVHTTFTKFREFVDFVYKYDFNLVQATVDSSNNIYVTNWDKTKKYVVTSDIAPKESDGTVVSLTNTKGDVYRYSRPLGKWVRAGLDYTKGDWSALNVFDIVNEITGNDSSSNYGVQAALDTIKKYFKTNIKNYIDVDDIAFHQAFIKFVSGTDNRAKNTYWQITGIKDYLIRLIQDDLDTIFPTDNNGRQSKPYNILEPSYREEDAEYWGDNGKNVFFRAIDQCFEEKIKNYLQTIISVALDNQKSVFDTGNYLYKNFFAVQANFPAVAFNHTAKIYYETAQIIKDMNKVFNAWTSNDVEPITQSHGSSLEYELYFMNKRLNFLTSYAKDGSSIIGNTLSTHDSAASGAEMKLKMSFEPYQDFYPTYYLGNDNAYYLYNIASRDNSYNSSTDITSIYDATNNLVTTGSTYSTTIDGSNINQGLYLIDLYKTLIISGLSTSKLLGNFDHLTEFTIDNNDSNYPLSNFSEISSSLPVLENLKLNNMQLPNTLDLSNCTKLKELNLSNTTDLETVILPQSTRLKTVVLPECIKNLNIYNNSGLTNLEFEGTENLESIYINCAKVGLFDVESFCELLVTNETQNGCPNLTSITLVNANLCLTEDAVQKIIFTDKCTLKGDIYIVNSAGDNKDNLKSISFSTKLTLVNKFGNIESEDSSIRFHYTSTDITDFTYNAEVHIYYQSGESGKIVRQNMFDVNVPSGNNVKIVSGTNPFNSSVDGYLNITYAFASNVSNATIDKNTGAITMTKESPNKATVNITMVTENSTIVHQSYVKFLWTAPQLGDFAYADGSFSSSYDSSKTMVGLVYAVDNTTDTSGTAYILGKEYAQPETLYLGYANDGNSNSSQGTLSYKIYQVSQFLAKSDINITEYDEVEVSTIEASNRNNITVSNYNITDNALFKGDTDTLAYINKVSLLLAKVWTYTNVLNYAHRVQNGSTWIYRINNKEHLTLLRELSKLWYSNLLGDAIMECLLYPYFYYAYLYQPEVKSEETLDDLYKANNWYVPSVEELSRVLFYRGYSVSGSEFNAASIVRNPINTSVANGGTTLTTPIFSLAKSRITNTGESFPAVWDNIADNDSGNNMTTTSAASSWIHNYGYAKYITSWTGTDYNYNYLWVLGQLPSDSWSNNSTLYLNLWRGSKTHQGVPFVKFNYSKS